MNKAPGSVPILGLYKLEIEFKIELLAHAVFIHGSRMYK